MKHRGIKYERRTDATIRDACSKCDVGVVGNCTFAFKCTFVFKCMRRDAKDDTWGYYKVVTGKSIALKERAKARARAKG